MVTVEKDAGNNTGDCRLQTMQIYYYLQDHATYLCIYHICAL